MTPQPLHLLFSYGTLRQDEVQRANFGRLLDGTPDSIIGYRLDTVVIDDPEVVAESGASVHPILVPGGSDTDIVEGMVFAVTDAELRAADIYETSAYRRVLVPLSSGRMANVYVASKIDS